MRQWLIVGLIVCAAAHFGVQVVTQAKDRFLTVLAAGGSPCGCQACDCLESGACICHRCACSPQPPSLVDELGDADGADEGEGCADVCERLGD